MAENKEAPADTPEDAVTLEEAVYVDHDGNPSTSGHVQYSRGDRIHPAEARRLGVHPSQRGAQKGENRQAQQGANRAEAPKQ